MQLYTVEVELKESFARPPAVPAQPGRRPRARLARTPVRVIPPPPPFAGIDQDRSVDRISPQLAS
jgi:hypothetical protein